MATVSCFNGGLISYYLQELRIFQATLYIIMAVPTIILNLLVLIGIWKVTTIHKPSKLILSSLASTDLLYGSIAMPTVATSNVAILQHHVPFYCYTWLVSRALAAWFGGMSLYTLAAISVDRFLAVKFKHSYKYRVTTRRVMPALLLGWIGIPLLMGISSYSISTNTKTNSRNRIMMAIAISILMAIITLCYSLAFYYLHKITRELDSMNSENQVTRSNFDVSGYRATLKTMVLILVVTILFYLPYVFFLTLERHGIQGQTSESLILVGEILMAMNSVINPILYVWRMKELRAAVKTTLKGIFGK